MEVVQPNIAYQPSIFLHIGRRRPNEQVSAQVQYSLCLLQDALTVEKALYRLPAFIIYSCKPVRLIVNFRAFRKGGR